MAMTANEQTEWYGDLEVECDALGIGVDEIPTATWERLRKAGYDAHLTAHAAAAHLAED